MAEYTTPSYRSEALPRLIIAEPHTLIAGATGSGKSTLIDAILYEICADAPCEKQFAIIDLKKISLINWKSFPHCKRYADTAEQAQGLIASVSSLMAERYEEMKQKGLRQYNGSHFYLIIDEAADLLDTCPQSKNDIVHIMRLGRASNIHIVYATQSPDKKTIFAQIQQNITCQVGLRCRDTIASRQIIGETGCELLPRYGKALVYTPALMAVTEYNVVMRTDAEIDELKQWWKDASHTTLSQSEQKAERQNTMGRKFARQVFTMFLHSKIPIVIGIVIAYNIFKWIFF